MPAVKDRDITQGHVAAILEADGFVTYAWSQGEVPVAAVQAFAPD